MRRRLGESYIYFWKKTDIIQSFICRYLKFKINNKKNIWFRGGFNKKTKKKYGATHPPPNMDKTKDRSKDHCHQPLMYPTGCSGGCWWWVASVVGGISGGLLQWVSEVGSSEWCLLAVMGVAVVGGCDSRCRHRVLLESLPGLTHPAP